MGWWLSGKKTGFLASHPLNMALHKNVSVLLQLRLLTRKDDPPFCATMRTISETQQPKVNYHDKFVSGKSVKQNNNF